MIMACLCSRTKKIGRIQGSGMKSLESLILELTIGSKQITFKIPFK